jgi:hypothetical protein
MGEGEVAIDLGRAHESEPSGLRLSAGLARAPLPTQPLFKLLLLSPSLGNPSDGWFWGTFCGK